MGADRVASRVPSSSLFAFCGHVTLLSSSDLISLFPHCGVMVHGHLKETLIFSSASKRVPVA